MWGGTAAAGRLVGVGVGAVGTRVHLQLQGGRIPEIRCCPDGPSTPTCAWSLPLIPHTSREMKNELMSQWDGIRPGRERIMVLGGEWQAP